MEWAIRASRQGGVITRVQLRAAGVSEGAVDGLVRRRQLRIVQPGVYVHCSAPRTEDQRQWIAVRWTGGVLSHRTAAGLWQLPGTRSLTVHVTVGDRRSRRYPSWIRLHRVPLRAAEVTDRDGLAVTTRIRTVLDLLRTERHAAAQALFDRAIQQGWLPLEEVQRSIVEGRGRTGNVQLRTLLASCEPGVEAESERVLHRLLRLAGIVGWVPQYVIEVAGRHIRVDAAVPASRLALEVDGRRYHDEASDRFADDRRRQNLLINAGWRVLRFTWRDLTDRPDVVMATIRQAVDQIA